MSPTGERNSVYNFEKKKQDKITRKFTNAVFRLECATEVLELGSKI